MNPKRLFTTFGLLLAVTLLAFLAGYLARGVLPDVGHPYAILAEAHGLLKNHGYSPVPEDPALEYGMIRGMLAAYGDPYASFLEPIQHEIEADNLTGSFGGIGVAFERDEDGHILLNPLPDSPAEQAGIQAGDRLLAVEDLQIEPDTPLETIQAAIRGEDGERVRIKIGHPPEYAPLDVVIERKSFALPTAAGNLHPREARLGIIKVKIIAASTPQEIQGAIASLQKQGATHFVLDLRDNNGGLLSAGIELARLFLPSGIILQQQFRGQAVETISVEQPAALSSLPLIVLINRNTASAAEIVAGALKANGRARLIGEPSFGKDSIQLVFDLQDGSSLQITAARWWIPGLQPAIAGNGVQPDRITSSPPGGDDAALEAARQEYFPP